MNHRSLCILTFTFLMAIVTSLAYGQDNGDTKKMDSNSPMLQPWTGPYGGVPPWNLVRSEEFVDAFDTAIAMADKDIAAIAENPEPANFENTIVALEKAGRALNRLETLFFVYTSNLNLGPIPDIEKVVVPKLSEHEDSIYQNEKLFARIAAVYRKRRDEKRRS